MKKSISLEERVTGPSSLYIHYGPCPVCLSRSLFVHELVAGYSTHPDDFCHEHARGPGTCPKALCDGSQGVESAILGGVAMAPIFSVVKGPGLMNGTSGVASLRYPVFIVRYVT